MLDSILPSLSASPVGLKAFTASASSNGSDASGNVSLVSESAIGVTADTSIDDLKTPIVNEVEEITSTASKFDLNASHIQSSPYADSLNHLNLQELDQPLRLFALALTQLQSTRPDYATAPYMASFNWQKVFEILRELCADTGIQWKRQDFYVVIFRSKLRAEADRTKLGELDQMSHQEACASGGLLHYWFGSPDAERRNLATCEYSIS